MKEKPIKLFYGQIYYPLGGQKDFIGYYENIESAKEFVYKLSKNDTCVWAHMIENEKIILHGNKDCKWAWETPKEPIEMGI